MATLDIAKKHALPHKAAKHAAEKIAEDLNERFALEYAWKADAIEFTRPGVTGRLRVGKNDVHLTCELGFVLSMLKPKIEEIVQRDFDKYFGMPRAKAKPAAKATSKTAGRVKR